MSERTYVSSSPKSAADLTWEEKNDSSYLLKDEVIRELQAALKVAREQQETKEPER
jgi:hypothetical protein